ncbi:MAG: GNAT family N-acetyltransferase, partial [Anaerolineae bacterium]|nr:GNAT family N-acetyltransferase [Anaerolineae bacterium]
MAMFRRYNPATDKAAVQRVWREVGWLTDKKEHRRAFDILLQASRALVAEVNGEAECLVVSMPGTIRYLAETLTFDAVTGVTTSRVARKQGLAGQLTARLVAAGAEEGVLVTGLGIFEQGYYDQLGFGSGNYEHWLAFDPAQLHINRQHRVPRRLTADDWKAVHASRLARHHGHGTVDLLPPEVTRTEMIWGKEAFGLGYADGPAGELTHYLWFTGGDKGYGPYEIRWLAYQTR